jgi:nucleoid-associated protein YgaU
MEAQIQMLKSVQVAPVATTESKPVNTITPENANLSGSDQQSQADIGKMVHELLRLREELARRNSEVSAPSAKPVQEAVFKRPGNYKVRPGDTLQSIARKTMGDSGHWVDIFKANKDRIKRGGEVTPGQVLIVP